MDLWDYLRHTFVDRREEMSDNLTNRVREDVLKSLPNAECIYCNGEYFVVIKCGAGITEYMAWLDTQQKLNQR
jgi:hypothetical protein